MLCRSNKSSHATAGFTLIEVLVALLLIATALSSLLALMAGNVRITRSMGSALTFLSTARAIISAIPERDQLGPGKLSGVMGGHPWRIEVSPFAAPGVVIGPGARWVPELLAVTVATPYGTKQLSTIRLQRKGDGP
jgi:general secretion pathway protein I